MDATLLQYAVGSSNLLANYARAGAAPAAVWDFGAGFSTHSWNVSRASGASYLDQGGLTSVGENTARIVATGTGSALLVEPAATNRCDPASYTSVNISPLVAGPTIGNVATMQISDNDGLGYYQLGSNSIAGLPMGSEVVFSIVLHAGSAEQIQLWAGIGATGLGRTRASINLVNQTATLTGNPDGVNAQTAIESLGNGLFRASLTSQVITTGDANDFCRITGLQGDLNIAFPQFEVGTVATSIIASPATERAPDQLVLEGLNGNFLAVIVDETGSETELNVSLSGAPWQPVSGPQKVARIMIYET